MASFTHEGLPLAYDDPNPDAGGRTVLLLHGFASNRHEGWRRTGWYAAFERRGFRMLALDQRGHGESAKPREPQAYARARLAGDALALLDHLGISSAVVFGYSMGSRTALETALAAPERVSDLILGGVGGRLLEPSQDRGTAMVEAMLAADPASITHPMLRSFRQFADEQGEDREALAAFVQAENPPLDAARLAGLPMPMLAVAGQQDQGAGEPDDLAQRFPNGRGVAVAGCDHFSAIPHALTKAAVFDFLDGLLDEPFDSGF